MTCVTHHHACECREAKHAAEVATLRAALVQAKKMAATVSDAQSSDLRGDKARADLKWAEAEVIEKTMDAALDATKDMPTSMTTSGSEHAPTFKPGPVCKHCRQPVGVEGNIHAWCVTEEDCRPATKPGKQ